MSYDPTIPQDEPERRRAQQLSLQSGAPPTQVPGYDLERLLGVGAYGQVWVGVEKNTGRRVAIKFYAHRGGLDWSLLSREVEKLAFLFADRYVVQLIGVGWDADPPYYVMEYLERGSLADRLHAGLPSVAEAVELFREIAVGLVHAHGKGVLHCDLKPANILLDQDSKPRLADFGQSRLSHEQTPALGTLFYMAPEQADLTAVPDARWDVYALGAILYCLLTGCPPYRTGEAVQELESGESLEHRLAAYRRLIRISPRPSAHRQVPGVDRALADIVDRLLAADPRHRYPNVQAVLAALDARAAQRALRPVMVLGAIGPALLLLVVSLFAWQGSSKALNDSGDALRKSEEALVQRIEQTNDFAALFVARNAANELERRYEAVETVARTDGFVEAAVEILQKPAMQQMLAELSEPHRTEAELKPLLARFRDDPGRKRLQQLFADLLPERWRPRKAENGKQQEVASWFFCDASGVSTCRVPEPAGDHNTIGMNFAWRSFFHGQHQVFPEDWRPGPGEHITETSPSTVFSSQASGQWIVAISTPVYHAAAGGKRQFLGVVALTVNVGRFVEFLAEEDPFNEDTFAVLVEWRDGPNKGVILQHPLFDKLYTQTHKVPGDFIDYRVTAEGLPSPEHPERMRAYQDPLGDHPAGAEYRRSYLARTEEIRVRGRPAGWLVIAQAAFDNAAAPTLAGLRESLIGYAAVAGLTVAAVVVGLWIFALRLIREAGPSGLLSRGADVSERPSTRVTPDAPTETHRRR